MVLKSSSLSLRLRDIQKYSIPFLARHVFCVPRTYRNVALHARGCRDLRCHERAEALRALREHGPLPGVVLQRWQALRQVLQLRLRLNAYEYEFYSDFPSIRFGQFCSQPRKV